LTIGIAPDGLGVTVYRAFWRQGAFSAFVALLLRMEITAGPKQTRHDVMNINGNGSNAALSSYLSGESPLEMRVALLKKAHDQMKEQGDQLIKMIEAAGTQPKSDHRLDVFA
jgi:hypothetical protein